MYGKWSRAARSRDLVAVALLTVVALVATLMGPRSVVLHGALAAPLVLVLPGYGLQAALAPQGAPRPLERLLLSIGLSLSCATLGGYLLNLTPWGLTPISWAAALGGVALISSGIAIGRRALPAVPAPRPRPSLRPRDMLLLALAALVAVGAVNEARIGAARDPGPPFTQLWLLPSAGPVPDTAVVGLHSFEPGRATYRVVIAAGGVTIWETTLDLDSGERWEATVSLPVPRSGVVDARLYRSDAPDQPYRRVDLAPALEEAR